MSSSGWVLFSVRGPGAGGGYTVCKWGEMHRVGAPWNQGHQLQPQTFAFCMYAPTNQPKQPRTKSSARQSSSWLMRSQIPTLPVSLLAACKIKHISGEKSWAEVRFWIQSSFWCSFWSSKLDAEICSVLLRFWWELLGVWWGFQESCWRFQESLKRVVSTE